MRVRAFVCVIDSGILSDRKEICVCVLYQIWTGVFSRLFSYGWTPNVYACVGGCVDSWIYSFLILRRAARSKACSGDRGTDWPVLKHIASNKQVSWMDYEKV